RRRRGGASGRRLCDLRGGAAHSGNPVDELARSGRAGWFRLGIRGGAGVGLRGGGSGGQRAARGVAVLCRGRALIVVLLLGPAERRVLAAAEDGLAEQVVVRAGVLELARRVGGRCGAPCRGATRRRDGLAVLGVLVVDRRDLRHRRLELVLRRAARGIVLRVGCR